MSMEHCIFGAGCFWGIQAVFDAVQGVVSTVVGYTGGYKENPTYEEVCADQTGHLEAVLVNFDNEIISFEELLDVFFANHNPTTLDRQGNDFGRQYRSAIYVANDEQEAMALKKIRELNEKKIYNAPIVTQVLREKVFYSAEEYHQKYLEKKGKSSIFAKPKHLDITQKNLKNELDKKQNSVLDNKKSYNEEFLYMDEDGVFCCVKCGNPIFISDNKFLSYTETPSFDEAIPYSIKLYDDFSNGGFRIKVKCAKCGAQLGYLFDDGPTQTGLRYSIDSEAMSFEAE